MCAYFILKCLALTACSILPKEMTGPRTRRLGDVFGRWRRFVFLSKHSVLCFFGTHASLVKPKNRLHRPKSSPCHPKFQYTGTEVLILRWLQYTDYWYCQKKWLDQEPEGLETFSVDKDDYFSYPNILFFVFLERMQVSLSQKIVSIVRNRLYGIRSIYQYTGTPKN